METNSAPRYYEQLDPEKKKKVDGAMEVLFWFNRKEKHPFIRSMYNMRREELSKQALGGNP